MRKPEDLTRGELRKIARLVQQWLYFNDDTQDWDLNNEVNGADFTQAMLELMDGLGMSPPDQAELERRKKHGEFVGFVDSLMKESPRPE